MTRKRLEEILAGFQNQRIVLAGDLFLDRWYEIDPALDEPSLETGKTAHQVVRKRSAPGAGGTVLNNLAAMGAGRISAISFVGNDGDGWELTRLLEERGIDTSRVIRSEKVITPSYIKPLFPEEGERLDLKNFRPTPKELEDALIDALAESVRNADAVILLDQVCEADCGVLTESVRKKTSELQKQYPQTVFLADSRAFTGLFRGVMIKCNDHEAAGLFGRTDASEPFCPEQVYQDLSALENITGKPAVITCNRHGIAVRSGGKFRLLPAVRHRQPIDICGAGDAATAGLILALCAGADLAEAAAVGNLASGVTVRKLGETGTASQSEMLALFDEQMLLSRSGDS